MFGSDILDVAIGMAFLFLFMSMIASALREGIENVMKKRATDLEHGLREMLRTDNTPGRPRDVFDVLHSLWPFGLKGLPPAPAGFATMADALYDHPLVASLFKGTYVEAKTQKTLPSYIPRESFSLAILDLLAGASAQGNQLSLANLQAALAAARPPNPVQRVVLTALATADGDLLQVRAAIETWYDATMDRVTGWYARRTALILFVLGFCAAVALNVDAIRIAKSLFADKPLRQAIVAQAEDYAKAASAAPAPAEGSPANGAQAKSFDELRTEFAEVGYPIGWTLAEDGWPYPTPQACQQPAPDKAAAAGAAKPAPDKPASAPICDGKNYFGMMLQALMGWFITSLAVMLGAPFWFDTLKKFISVRSSLKPPDGKAKKKAKQAPAGASADDDPPPDAD